MMQTLPVMPVAALADGHIGAYVVDPRDPYTLPIARERALDLFADLLARLPKTKASPLIITNLADFGHIYSARRNSHESSQA
jgi:hypothetical protein